MADRVIYPVGHCCILNLMEKRKFHLLNAVIISVDIPEHNIVYGTHGVITQVDLTGKPDDGHRYWVQVGDCGSADDVKLISVAEKHLLAA